MGPKLLAAAAQAMPIPAAGPHWLGWALRRNGEDEPRWADIDTIVRAASTKPAADASVYIWDVSCKLAAQGSSFNPQDCWDSLVAAINKIFDAVNDSAPRGVHESSTTNTVAPGRRLRREGVQARRRGFRAGERALPRPVDAGARPRERYRPRDLRILRPAAGGRLAPREELAGLHGVSPLSVS